MPMCIQIATKLFIISLGSYLYGEYGTSSKSKSIFPGARAAVHAEEEKHYHFFYMYTSIYFAVMAVSCYGGRICWRIWQGRLLSDLIGNLKRRNTSRATERPELQVNQDVEEAARILLGSMPQHDTFLTKFLLYEVINCVILIVQLFSMMMIAGESFWWNAPKIFYYIGQPYSEWPFEVAKVFPLVTKCSMKTHGPSGNQQVFDLLCFLNYNQVTYLLFTIHWFLVIGLLFFSVFSTALHFRKIRNVYWRVYELRSILYLNNLSDLYDFMGRLSPGTCFIVSLLAKNLSAHVVCDILRDFRLQLNARGNRNG